MPTQQIGIEFSIRSIARVLNGFSTLERAYAKLGASANKENARIAEATSRTVSKTVKGYDQIIKKYLEAAKVNLKTTDQTTKAQIQHDKLLTQVSRTKSTIAKTDALVSSSEYRYRQEIEKTIQSQIRYRIELEKTNRARLYGTTRTGGGGAGISGGGDLGGISSLAASVGGIWGKIAGIGAAIVKPFQWLMKPLEMLWKFFTGPLSLAGLSIMRVFEGIGNAIRNVASEAVEAVSDFQALQVQFESLSARDIAQELGISVADAFDKAVKRAKGLAYWVKQIAVTTPFTVKSISEALAFANAMGLNIEFAKKLTIATGNFVAAMGLGDEAMYRIIYNFGQMYQQGKLTGREFRDLAVNFVPINDILIEMADKAGMAKDEFKKIALEGGVPVEDFFATFINMANRDFPNAMKRMSETWRGVMNNIKDFVQVVLGTELLGPIFDDLSKGAAKFLQSMLAGGNAAESTATKFENAAAAATNYHAAASELPAIHINAMKTGAALRYALRDMFSGFNEVVRAVKLFLATLGITAPSVDTVAKTILRIGLFLKVVGKDIANFIRNSLVPLAQKIKTWFTDVGSEQFKNGLKFISEFARGIIKGIGSVLLTAIKAVKAFLSHFFKPKSPPLIAPDIDKWGTETMTEFLRGMTEADFNTLEKVESAIKDVFSALVETGALGDDASELLRVEVTKELIKAMDEFNKTGVLSNSIVQRMREVGGEYGDELATLLITQIEYNKAVEASAAAQERLNRATKELEGSQIRINKAAESYNRALHFRYGDQVQKARMNEYLLERRRLIAAFREKSAADAANEAAKENEKITQDRANAQENLLKQLLGLVPNLKAGGAGGAAGTIIEDLMGGLGGEGGESIFTDITESIDEWIKTLRQQLEPEITGFWKSIKEAWADKSWIDGAGKSFEKLALTVANGLGGVAQQGTLFFMNQSKYWGEWWELHGGNLQDIIKKVGDSFGGYFTMEGWFTRTIKQLEALRGMLELIIELIADVVGTIIDIASGADLRTLHMDVQRMVENAMGNIDTITGKEHGTAMKYWERLLPPDKNIQFDYGGQLNPKKGGGLGAMFGGEAGGGGLGAIFSKLIDDIGKSIETSIPKIMTPWNNALNGIKTSAQELYNDLVGKSIFPEMMADIERVIQTKIQAIVLYFDQHKQDFKDKGNLMMSNLRDGFQEIITQLIGGGGAVGAAAGAEAGLIGTWITQMETVFTNAKQRFYDAGVSLMQSFKDGMISIVSTLVGALTGGIQDVKNIFWSLYQYLVGGSLVPDMMDEIYDVMTTRMDDVIKSMAEKGTGVYNTLKDTLTALEYAERKRMMDKRAGIASKPVGLAVASQRAQSFWQLGAASLGATGLNRYEDVVRAPAYFPKSSGTPSVALTFGNVSISNGMDQAAFAALVKDTVVQALK